MHKVAMWCVGNHNIPHARQDTNVVVESFHSNMKRIFMLFIERFIGHRLDWLIFHLVRDVFTHYWYNVQCKLFGYVKNKKQEGIIASTVLRVRNSPNSNVLSHHDGEDIAYVTSINHTPKVWTNHIPSSKWPQCDCPLAEQGIACEHVMKVFKMLHLNILNGAIVRDKCTFHGINKCPPTSKHMICDDLLDQQLDIDPKNEDPSQTC
jgi:hypothetical protein